MFINQYYIQLDHLIELLPSRGQLIDLETIIYIYYIRNKIERQQRISKLGLEYCTFNKTKVI